MKVILFQSIHTTIISNIQKSLGKGSGWIIDSAIDHTISISKYNRNSYIKLPKKLDQPRKGFINTQNIDDNECFKWCLVRYINLHPARITKVDKDFAKKLDFKDIKFLVKKLKIYIKLKKKTPSTFCRYCLQAFSTKKILKCHITD